MKDELSSTIDNFIGPGYKCDLWNRIDFHTTWKEFVKKKSDKLSDIYLSKLKNWDGLEKYQSIKKDIIGFFLRRRQL